MAFGTAVNFAAGAVDDLFGQKGSKYSAKGLRIQAASYDKAAEFSLRNVDYTRANTEIQLYQTQRKQFSALGQLEADIAGAGFTAEGSGGDLLRMSQADAALEQATLRFQGAIAEEGFRVQAESYQAQSKAALMAAKAADKASKGNLLGGILKGAAAVGSLFV